MGTVLFTVTQPKDEFVSRSSSWPSFLKKVLQSWAHSPALVTEKSMLENLGLEEDTVSLIPFPLYSKVPLPKPAFSTPWNYFCSILSLSSICLLSTVKYHDIYFIRRSYINLLLMSSRESTLLFWKSYNLKSLMVSESTERIDTSSNSHTQPGLHCFNKLALQQGQKCKRFWNSFFPRQHKAIFQFTPRCETLTTTSTPQTPGSGSVTHQDKGWGWRQGTPQCSKLLHEDNWDYSEHQARRWSKMTLNQKASLKLHTLPTKISHKIHVLILQLTTSWRIYKPLQCLVGRLSYLGYGSSSPKLIYR